MVCIILNNIRFPLNHFLQLCFVFFRQLDQSQIHVFLPNMDLFHCFIYSAANDNIISGNITFLPKSYCCCCSGFRPTKAAPDAELLKLSRIHSRHHFVTISLLLRQLRIGIGDLRCFMIIIGHRENRNPYRTVSVLTFQ